MDTDYEKIIKPIFIHEAPVRVVIEASIKVCIKMKSIKIVQLAFECRRYEAKLCIG